MTFGLSSFVDWLIRHRARVLVFCGVLFCIAGARTALTYSKLRSDLEELLPATAPAVTALETLRSRLPGLRHLGIVVDTGGKHNLPAARRFIDDLSRRLEAYPKELVGEVRADVKEEQQFANTYLLQLMDLEDVVALRKAVEARRDWEVTRALDMNLLESDEDPPPELPVQRLRQKYLDKHKLEASFPDGRLESKNGDTAVLLVQTAYHSTGQDGDETLLGRVRNEVKALGFPDRYAPGMRVGFAADVATRVEELEGLQTDLTLSGVLVSALVVAVIVWYFQAWQAPLILGIPLALGTVCAFGVAALPPFNIRHLNSNTAFLGAIVVGNGVNTGIIVLARFQEERRRFAELQEAIVGAIRETWKPTLAAAASASAAYGSLVFTDFRGFNQFGWIGGIGMLLCWATTMVLLPPLLSFFGEGTARRARPEKTETDRHIGWFARFLLSRPRVVAAVTLTATLLALFGIGRRASDWIEYDLSQLRRRDSWESGERYWGARMDRTLGRYLTPSVVMADTPEQAENIKHRLQGLAQRNEAGDLIANVQTASSWLPPTRFAAVKEARAIDEALTPRLRGQLSEEDRKLVEGVLTQESLTPLEPKDLPGSLVAGMREKDGRIDRSVLVYPKLGGGTWNAARIQAFSDDVRREAKAESPTIQAAGTVLLSSDIARALKHDGPQATALSLLAVLGICVATFRRGARANGGPVNRRGWFLSFAAISSLLLGVLFMLGGLAWTGTRLNFSNFVALPITFGIGADYSINVLQRYQEEGKLDVSRVLKGTGGAVALCSATTIIGFGSLLVAQNRALFSFGVFAVSGEFASLVTAVIVLPSLLLLGERARRRASRAESAA